MASERRKLAIGASWTAASTLVALIAAAILNPLIVVYLGVDGYGIWATAIAIASLVGLGGDLGVAGALTKFVAERKGQRKEVGSLAGSALVFGLLAGLVAGAALMGLSLGMRGYLGHPQFPLLLQLQAAQMPFNLGTASLLAVLQGGRQFRKLALFGIAQSVGGLSASLAFIVAGQGLAGVMIAGLMTSALGFGCLLLTCRRDLHYGGFATLRSDIRRLVPFGIALTATNALSTVLYRVDVVVLSFLVQAPTVVGAYALAVFITRGLWILPSSISTTTYPAVSQYSAAGEHDRVSRYLPAALTASAALTGILATSLILFGRPALQVVFGPGAQAAYEYALWLLIGTAALGTLRSVAPSLPAIGRPVLGFAISAVSATILTALALAMTAAFGATGASVAVSVAFTIDAALLVWAIDRYILRPKPGLMSSRTVVRTAAVAVVAAVGAVGLASPIETTLAHAAAGAVLLIAASVALIKASGGRDTWGPFLGRPRWPLVERG